MLKLSTDILVRDVLCEIGHVVFATESVQNSFDSLGVGFSTYDAILREKLKAFTSGNIL